MSIRAIVWAFDQECKNAAAKLVLIKLADNANDDGECWPSREYLAKHCEMGASTVSRHCQDLAARGLIEILPRFKNNVQISNCYRLILSKENPLGNSPDTFSAMHPGGAPVRRGGCTSEKQNPHRTLIESKNEEPASPEPSAHPLDPEIKKAADAVYCQSPEDFKKLIIWIRQAQKYGWSTAGIVKSLIDFRPRAKDIGKGFWPYLDEILKKAEPKLNARSHEAEHRRKKEEEREGARKLFE